MEEDPMSIKQQIIGWVTAVVLALSIYNMGFASKNVCDRLQKTIGQHKPAVVPDYLAEADFMEGVRAALQNMIDTKTYNVRFPIHLHMMHRNITVVAEVWIEGRADGTYVCEDSCDYVAGELKRTRDNKCFKIQNQ
jgi:hypothetical protein